MAVFVLDTSAVVKRYVTETGSAWVRSLTHARSGHTLYLASITAVEVTSAITRRQRGGNLSSSQAAALLGHFRRHLLQRYLILELTPSLLADAATAARTHALRAYDAVQLAAALEVSRIYLPSGLGLVTLLSADRELNAAALAESLAVEDPTAHPRF